MIAADTELAGATDRQAPSTRLYRNYLLTLLMVLLAFNYADRMAIGILLQDIKADLALSDTQLGFLTGLAFAVFYAVMGVPIARWADRGDRVTIISLTAALWGAAVALCGAASGFVSMLLIRIGVAVGEAGCQPPALSLLSDYFGRGERPRAVSRYMLGLPIAIVIGNFAAGWLNQYLGWRGTFVILGIPGPILAVLAWFSLREPRRAATARPASAASSAAAIAPPASLRTAIAPLWANKAYRHVLFCFAVTSFFSYGILLWEPTFFVRTHRLTSGELGTWYAVIAGFGGFIGTYLGGEVAARWAPNNERLQLAGVGILYASFTVIKAGVYLAPNHYIAFAILTVCSLAGAMGTGPIFAATQTLVPPHLRATSIALILFCSNLIGMGLGPLAAGALSDLLQPFFGEDSLRYSLLLLCPGYLWAGWHGWMASRHIAVREGDR